MQHGEGKQSPEHQQNARCVQGPCRFCVFLCVFALGSAGAKDNCSVLSMEKSRDPLRQALTEEFFSDQ